MKVARRRDCVFDGYSEDAAKALLHVLECRSSAFDGEHQSSFPRCGPQIDVPDPKRNRRDNNRSKTARHGRVLGDISPRRDQFRDLGAVESGTPISRMYECDPDRQRQDNESAQSLRDAQAGHRFDRRSRSVTRPGQNRYKHNCAIDQGTLIGRPPNQR